MVTRAEYIAALQTEKAFVDSRAEMVDAEKARRLRDIDDELAAYGTAPVKTGRASGRGPETA
jgi:hypothetical protein